MLHGWDEGSAQALLAAQADVARRRDGGPARAAVALVESTGRHLFDEDVAFADVPEMTVEAVADAAASPEQRDLLVQVLVMLAYAAPPVDERQVAAVDEYAAALGVDRQSVKDLHRVRDEHIHRLFLDHNRRAFHHEGQAMPLPHKVAKTLHEYVGSPKVAARYAELEGYEDGTLGKTFFRFYRERGFSLPGEHHSLGEFFVGHDCAHILSGFNTDAVGELNVAGFEAGMRAEDYGFELLMEVMLDFQLGIDLGVSYVGYATTTDQMDAEQIMVGVRRGLGCNIDFMGPAWHFWDAAPKQVTDLRAEYEIVGVDGVVMDPPTGDNVQAATA